jgi:hypothetical protein
MCPVPTLLIPRTSRKCKCNKRGKTRPPRRLVPAYAAITPQFFESKSVPPIDQALATRLISPRRSYAPSTVAPVTPCALQDSVLVTRDGWAWWPLRLSVVRVGPHGRQRVSAAPRQMDEWRVLAVSAAPWAITGFGGLGAGVLGWWGFASIRHIKNEAWLGVTSRGRSGGRRGGATASLGRFVGGNQVGERDLSWASKRPRASRRKDSEISRP